MRSRWPRRPFSSAAVEIIDGDRGKEYPKHGDFSDSGYCLFLNTGNVRPDGFDFSNCQFISEEKDQRLRKGKLMRHDLVMTTRGTIGNVAYYDDNVPYENVRINSGMVIFRVDSSGLYPKFLYHFLRSPDFIGQTISMRSGVAQPQFPIRDIRRVELPTPDLAIQDRIASLLSAYDDLIENNRRRMALLEAASRQLYREWFVRLRFPGHEHTQITDGVPQGWKQVPTPEAVDINPRTALSDDEEHWYVEMSDLPTDSMVISGAVKRDGRSGSKFRNGDTLLARITPCLENGKTGFVNFLANGETGRGSTEFIVLRSKRVTPEFVYCLARTYDFRENAIKSMIGSSGRQRVQESCFEKFMVPPLRLLNLFSEFVGPLFQQIKSLHTQNQKLRAARDLLLPRLISGEIVV
jgi:type I restriction enzyme S subunit